MCILFNCLGTLPSSIIAVCLPTYGPLFRQGRELPRLVRKVASNFSSRSSTSNRTTFPSTGNETDDLPKIFKRDTILVSETLAAFLFQWKTEHLTLAILGSDMLMSHALALLGSR